MEVIPVIDLMGGQVVHARRGERDAYQPIRSDLTATAEPIGVTSALLALAPFRTLYVADLDALRGRGDHDRTVSALRATFRDLEIWVDRGETDILRLRERAARGPGVSVIGTESFADEIALRRALGASAGVLSLDHDSEGPMGPAAVHADPRFWPKRLIVMTLARVGADSGPDLERLRDVKARAGDRSLFAAGGVRGVGDLEALNALGIDGVLVASALHDGRLTRADLARFARARPRTASQP